MRNIFILTILLATNVCFAQTPVVPLCDGCLDLSPTKNGYYYKDLTNKYNPWVGTWQYTDGSNTVFKVVITKVEAVLFPESFTKAAIIYYADVLNGGYYYKENGIVKTDHLIYTNQIEAPILEIGKYSTLNSKLRFFFREIDKSPSLLCGYVDFTLLPGSTTQATWVFDASKKRNFSVPDNIILTKE
jgi:hypothetical protein